MIKGTRIPEGYVSALSLYETQEAIELIKKSFAKSLSNALRLKRVSAPLFVEGATGLNDDLNGVERPVAFTVKETGTKAQVVHSLAKWKRYALYEYGFPEGEGLYTDMNAIRRDENLAVPSAAGGTGPQYYVCYHPGAGGHVSEPEPQSKGKPFSEPSPYRGDPADRRSAALRQAP